MAATFITARRLLSRQGGYVFAFFLSVSRITEKFNEIFGGADSNTLDPKGLHH